MRNTFLASSLSLALLLAACSTSEKSDEGEPPLSVSTEAGEDMDAVVVTGERVSSAPSSPGDVASIPPPPPPPPPPMRVMTAEEAYSDGSAVSRDISEVTTSAIAPEPRMEADRSDGEIKKEPDKFELQSGILTAGDYDDHLNPELYHHYVTKKLQGGLSSDLPYIDLQDRFTIKVHNKAGKPVFNYPVTIAAENDYSTTWHTNAKGEVHLYPAYDELGKRFQILKEEPVWVDLSQYEKTPAFKRSLTINVDFEHAKAQAVDIVWVIDATGSMSDELRYIQAELYSIISSINRRFEDLDLRIGLVFYRDIGDEYVVRDFALTSDIETVQENLSAQHANGGGNMPEAMDQALAKANDFDWRHNAAKIMVLVADAPPHDVNINKTWDAAKKAREDNIHIVSLAASGVDDRAEFIMRAMAVLTNSRYLFLTDDSGIGNPHAEPEIDCYIVTRLDTLIGRVLQELVSGIRIEPDEGQIIRSVGPYKHGVCEMDQKPDGT